ncbi:hypothetical protein MASR2M48_18660 [Spirochaetota bacterium]
MKVAVFGFTGSLPCFSHALLNVLDMNERNDKAILIIEGASAGLLPELLNPTNPLYPLFKKIVDQGYLDCVCKACASKLGTLELAKEASLPIRGDMSGHPSFKNYLDEGYTIITV